ncbi:MAG: hypothetical protein PHD86_03835 [Kiritimatiellae bacterium]|nr:hypothetical protein [Kiritimatiellia bacterium]
MKKIMLLFISLVPASFAGLGLTPEESDKAYGKPYCVVDNNVFTNMVPPRGIDAPWQMARVYELKNKIQLTAHFYGGANAPAQCEMIWIGTKDKAVKPCETIYSGVYDDFINRNGLDNKKKDAVEILMNVMGRKQTIYFPLHMIESKYVVLVSDQF